MIEEVEGDYMIRSTLMIEIQSYEYVIEGLKEAADGARHYASRRMDMLFVQMAQLIDKLRYAAAKHYGRNNPADIVIHDGPRSNALGRKQALLRISGGLDKASKGARQIATCHRGDLWWSYFAQGVADQHDKAKTAARIRLPVYVN